MNGWDRDDEENIQERVVEARLALAQAFVADGKAEDAERLYKQTLGHAEASAGENSPLAGSVLLDLIDLYEAQGRHDEAKVLWVRVRKILLINLPQLLKRSE
jgi:tetratricopeptide (TPR) repeat protein